MANHAKAPLCFLLVIVFLATLKVEAARDSKYFSKFNTQVDQPSFKPSSEIKNYNDDFNFEIPENDVPPEEFIESMKKNPSETKTFSRDFDQPSYTTGPQIYREKDGDDDVFNLNKEDVSANDVFKLTDEEKKFFNNKKEEKNSFNTYSNDDDEEIKKFFDNKKDEKNSYNTYSNDDDEEIKKFFDNKKEGRNSFNTYNNNNRENVAAATKAQGMSDTRTLENGNYFYNPRVVRANSGSVRSEQLFGNKQEYRSKDDEFRPLKDFEYNPQNQFGFAP